MTKSRYQVLRGEVAERVRELVRQTCEALEIRIVRGVISLDQPHILVSALQNLAPSEIKRRTLSYLMEDSASQEALLGRVFLGEGLLLRHGGEMTEEMIKQYLEYRFEPHPKDDFRMEPD